MRILMLTWEYPPHLVGGLGRHVAELVPALDAAGAEITVVTPWLRGGPQEEQIGNQSQIYRVETPSMLDYGFISFAQETNRVLEQTACNLASAHGPFDVIHCHDWLTIYAGVSLKYSWHRPLITTIHATERGRARGILEGHHAQTINGLEWWATHESWRVIVCSQFMAEQIQHYFNTPIDKINIIPNGVHVPEIEWSTSERQAFRDRYAHSSEQLLFSVARLVYEKGLHLLIEALPYVLQRHKIKCIIAGVGHELDALKQRSHELGIAQHIYFAGFITDEERDKLYSVANAAIFPSLYEPFGIVALEAMAAQCPVIVSDTGGLSEVVELHETGITVHPDDVYSLAWGIDHTLAYPDWAAQRSENACKIVTSLYTWQNIAQKTLAIYNTIHNEYQQSPWGETES